MRTEILKKVKRLVVKIGSALLVDQASGKLRHAWLEAMAAPGAPKPPVRLAALYMPNGVNVDAWIPKGKGRDFELSETLEPLRPVKDSVTVVSNLWNQNAKGGDGHYVKEASILTCATIKKTPGADIGNGVSVDQLAAQKVAGETPLPSLCRSYRLSSRCAAAWRFSAGIGYGHR